MCFSIKDMERVKKSLETRLKQLMDNSAKDQVVTFEELLKITNDGRMLTQRNNKFR